MKCKEETAIVAAVRDAVLAAGVTVWRNQSGVVRVKRGFMHLAPAGTPDLVGYAQDGRFVALEVKRPKGKERPRQLAFLARASAAGCIVGVVRSPPEALEVLRVAGALQRAA